ncbi:M50 family metallopeptidase [Virgibacillus flavescens]|uniref:M50 family metallopeptidase n=1 Tax=Virgibacillus flavescens TaxID=1611422 RepID=UPI003D357106
MTFLKILPTIHIHPLLIIFLFIGFITGTFMEIVIMLGIVLFHELGHYLMAISFKWRINSITLWVFGGVMDTEEHGSRPVYEEALVSIAGPFQHAFIYLFIIIVTPMGIIPYSVMEIIIYYNNVILLFNLLPVWPLDGGKFVFTILSGLIPFKKAHRIMVLTSICIAASILFIQLVVFPFTMSAVFIMLFILVENRTEWKQHYYVFLRFLSNRFYKENDARKTTSIKVAKDCTLFEVFSLFIRGKKHTIHITYDDGRETSIDERECLRSYFQEKHYNITVEDIERTG